MALDLLLINVPVSGVFGIVEEAREHRQPLGLSYIASWVEKQGYSVKILDCDAEQMAPIGFTGLLTSLQPRVVGFTCTTPGITTVFEMAGMVKEFNKQTLVIAGGSHVTVLAEDTLRQSMIDIVVRGEGELATAEILEYVHGKKELSSIRGISYSDKDTVVHTQQRELIKDIDSLPLPARHLLPVDRYRARSYFGVYGEKIASIMATRGCPYCCSFCGQSAVFGHSVRKRKASAVVYEMHSVVKESGIRTFLFEDSTFTAYPELVEETCNEILRRNLKLRWGAMGRVNLADEELYRLMKQAGCMLIFYGVESGNQAVLNRMHKDITLEEARAAVSIAKKVGIPVNASFILGVSGDDIASMQETIRFALELDSDYATFSLATPYPGTEFYDEAVREGFDVSSWEKFRRSRYTEPIYAPQNVTREELKALYKSAYRQFYLRPRYLWKSLSQITSVRDLLHKIRVAKSFFS